MTLSSTRRASRPLALITTSALVVAFALGGWVPRGRTTEQLRPSTVPAKHTIDPGRAQAEKAGVDVDAVVDKVRHRVTPAGDGSLSAHDEQYRARFDTEGFGFMLGDQASGLEVSLRRVRRGGDILALVPGAWRGEANVAVRELGTGMTERVTARAGELEWDVVLDRPLPGTGDLRVEAALRGFDGSPARIADGGAWRFPLGDGGAARMGEVVVKDATDAELHRALPQVRGEVVYLEVPASVLADARYPLTVDPTVGPELSVGVPVYGNAFYDQTGPAVAWNGTDFLVVWQDERRDPNGGFSDIYAARVNGAGNVLDPEGIAISTAANGQSSPAVAWNGTNFLVVWADQRVCCESGFYQSDIYAARVSGAGSVLDPAGIPVFADTDNLDDQSAPAVAWNGTNFLVVWQEGPFGAIDIHGARVSGAGNVLDPAGIPISTSTGSQSAPAVASNGTNFLVVWMDSRSGSSGDIYGTRVSGAGTVLDPAGIAISTAASNQSWPAVAWNGTNFLVVWQDFWSGSTNDIYGTRVSGAGTVLDPAGIPISTSTGSQSAPAVAWNGTNFLVVWTDLRSGSANDIYGTRVSGAGTVLDPSGIAVSTAANEQASSAVAWNGSDFLVVWDDTRAGSHPDIYGARVSGAGSGLDPAGIALSTQPNTQRVPAVAWNGTDFLVVWEDGRGPSIDIYGARISGSGTVLDPAGIPIATTADHELTPEVAWNGTNFLVVWQDFTVNNKDIYGARVSAAGSVLDAGGIPIATATNGHYPAVASSGSDFLVVWQKSGPSGPSGNDIYGARVTSAGTVLDPAGIPVSTATGGQAAATVAWNGTDFLVVWQDQRSGAFSDIYGSRVSSAGTVLDPTGIPISTAANHQFVPAVASWGDNFLVVWQDRRSGTNYDIYGAGVGANGTVAQAAGIPIATAAGDQTAPDLAVRYHFLVAWRDRRSGTSHDIYATRVRPSGVVEEPAGLLVSSAATDEGAPAVTGGPGATWGVAYDRMLTDSPFEPGRAFLRSVSPK